jgi:hypothetical protein
MSKVPHEENSPHFQSPQQSIFDNVRVGGNLTVRDIIQQIFIGGDSPSQRKEFRNRQILLKQVKNEVDSRLEQSLHNAVLINLTKEKQPQQVKRPWDVEVKVGNQPSETLPQEERIIDFFDREAIAGKFLILGAPGSGKTTTMLELAGELVTRAENDVNQPMPVLFNLSSWKDDKQAIAQWLIDELKDKYGVRKNIGERWLKEHELLPLLDGLDELASERQEKCVQAINHFLESEERSLYLVVCSRFEEYLNYETQLQLNGAICLQSLADNQIRYYLAAIDLDYSELWQSLSNDPDLLELVRTPLFLSITLLAYKKISLEKWQKLLSAEARIQYLLDAYISEMLTRQISSQLYPPTKLPTARQTRLWLAWLAQQLQQESETEFLIERLQPFHLISSTNSNDLLIYLIADWGLSLLAGSFYGLTNKLIDKIGYKSKFKWHYLSVRYSPIGYLIDICIRPIIGIIEFIEFTIYLTIGYCRDKSTQEVFRSINDLLKTEITPNNMKYFVEKIDTFEIIVWSWKEIKSPLFTNFIIWLGLGIVFGIFFENHFNIEKGDLLGITLGLIYGLSFGLRQGLCNSLSISDIKVRKIPNEGIKNSLKNAYFIGLIFGFSFWIFISIITVYILIAFGLTKDTLLLFLCGLSWGLRKFFTFFLVYGGNACAQHFTLRLILHRNRSIPWNYSRFLDYCTKRMFLQRVGGRYRFIHRLLQEHFAQMALNQE